MHAVVVNVSINDREAATFESEDAARAVADRISDMLTDAVTLESVDVGEVIESA